RGIFACMLTIKKSLGQHFLKDENVSRRIIEVIQERPLKNLVEVGPGGGALTKYLVNLPGVNLKCIEIDDEKVKFLADAFPRLKNNIIHEDILETGVPFDEPFTLVGNFPYNISTQIIFRVIEWKNNIESMIGMFQKEVAQRIAAKEGSKIYGVTSVLVQAYFSVDYLFEVEENAFHPPPKVKSAVISLTPLSTPVTVKSDRALSVLVKTAFNQRRKTLRNAVKSLFTADTLKDEIFNKRAEELSVQQFAELTFTMH
ncbi:MAG TPA: 16S rRNA (adenine(1518)-N(6)/adenine(1519)-N(6))-dimethyltransferase RsmA, partial [Flavitalea sp.]|nr:16S rRNA (adenine(1518)-N(6)/adenine(1519)-N(6))-dimethyltransferase RsmA [Flavitalea sp.]